MRVTLIASCCFLSALSSLTWAGQITPNEPQKFDPKFAKAPVAINSPKAEIPDAAWRTATSGACLVSLVVDDQGYPQKVHTLRCTDPMFEKNSIDAVNKYRFKPARRISDDVAVPVLITVDITYRLHGRKPLNPVGSARYQLLAPPASSEEPDSSGVYSLNDRMDAPQIEKFDSKVFAEAAYALSARVECRALVVINAKGKPQSAEIDKCDPSEAFLRGAAVQSIMKSKYKPARLHGQAIPVRVIVDLIYGGGSNGPKSTANP